MNALVADRLIKGIKRERANRYDYVGISHDGANCTIAVREGGERPAYADLPPAAVRKLIAGLEAILIEMGAS
jgi:hypothetical protein